MAIQSNPNAGRFYLHTPAGEVVFEAGGGSALVWHVEGTTDSPDLLTYSSRESALMVARVLAREYGALVVAGPL